MQDLDFRSSKLPGGSFLYAMYDRRLMQLSDRGGASGLIGERWSDICDAQLRADSTAFQPVGLTAGALRFDHLIRLDDTPQIAQTASRNGLQNPDFLIANHRVIQAVDAKFSVETAKSSQVSAESLAALLELGPVLSDHLATFPAGLDPQNGLFLSPDYSLTWKMLERGRGPHRRLQIPDDEVYLLAIATEAFLEPLPQREIFPMLMERDGFPSELRESLLVALYYLRLACSTIGSWADRWTSLIGRERPVTDLQTLAEEMAPLIAQSKSGWDAVLRFDLAAEEARGQRQSVDRALAMPIHNQELRDQLLTASAAAGVVPPSVSQVRKQIGLWFNAQVLAEFGPVPQPVADFPTLLKELSAFARGLRRGIDEVKTEVIADLIAKAEPLPT